MQTLQNIKTVLITPPATKVDDAAFTTATVDTNGFAEARFVLALGDTDIALAAFKLQESNASNMGSAADVPGADFSVSPLTLPSADDDNKLYAIHVNLAGRKRYLDLSVTAGNGSTGTFAVAWCDLYPGTVYPSTLAERGFAQEAIV